MIRSGAALIAAFLVGAFPTAYLAGRIRGIDLRKEGSGNVGATNAVRVMGKGVGYCVFLVDFFKGFLPTYFLSKFFLHVVPAGFSMILWLGIAAILGHVFCPFLGFKGGKGVATGAGVTCAVNAPFFLMSASIWIIIFFCTRIVSVSSLLAVFSLSLFSIFFNSRWPMLPFFVLLFGIALWTHRENIRRLAEGKEHSFG